jgi:hypothetical protein
MFFRGRISNAKQNQAHFSAELGGKTISPAASFILGIHFKNSYFVIRGAHLARSIIENTCWEGLDRIFRECVEMWTLRRHQGRSIAVI